MHTNTNMLDLFSLTNKVALVTGGSKGIGAMIAEGFVKSGAKTYICARNEEACKQTAEKLSQWGECIPLAADLSKISEIKKLCEQLREHEQQLDILVNNAGANWAAPFDSFPEKGWDRVFDLNIKSPFFLIQELFEMLKTGSSKEDPSRIINIGSVMGLVVNDNPTYAYAVSKAGLHQLTKKLARDFASKHILVNAILPGPFATDMTAGAIKTKGEAMRQEVPLKRFGNPSDIAGPALFLASKASSYVTGVLIPVDGGVVGCN